MRYRPSRATESRFGIGILLLGCSALGVGCGRRVPAGERPQPPEAAPPSQVTPPAPPSEAPPEGQPREGQPRVGQVPRLMVYAGPLPGTTVTLVPSEPEEEPEPTVGYSSLRVACDSVEALTKRHIQVAVSRADGVPVDFGLGGSKRTGCELKAAGKFAPPALDSNKVLAQTPRPDEGLEAGFKDAGWVHARYQADGPDGEVEGWRSKETTCVMSWSWDGGDDSDSTYVPSDDWALVVGCVPWELDDSNRQ